MPQWVSCKAIEQKAAPGGRRAGIWRLLQEKHPKMMGKRSPGIMGMRQWMIFEFGHYWMMLPWKLMAKMI